MSPGQLQKLKIKVARYEHGVGQLMVCLLQTFVIFSRIDSHNQYINIHSRKGHYGSPIQNGQAKFCREIGKF